MPSPIRSMRDMDALGAEYGIGLLLEKAGLTREEMVDFASERVTQYCVENGIVAEDRDSFIALMTLCSDGYLHGLLRGRGECGE